MHQYVEYLNIPQQAALTIVAVFVILQFIGEFLEVQGRAVPEFIKIRKYFARKKEERKAIREMPQALREVRELLNDVESHYSTDNITKRNKWMRDVDSELCHNEDEVKNLRRELLKVSDELTSFRLDSMRSEIISFAAHVVDPEYIVTHEQFNRIFKLHKEYERIIEEKGRTNGEIDVAYRIISESYEEHLRNKTFVENVRGYKM